MRDTSTTASYSSVASSAGTSSARSQTTCRAPSGTSPDRPRVTHVTSCPRATASVAVALDRNTLPPSTRIRMRTPDPVRYPRGKRFRCQQTRSFAGRGRRASACHETPHEPAVPSPGFVTVASATSSTGGDELRGPLGEQPSVEQVGQLRAGLLLDPGQVVVAVAAPVGVVGRPGAHHLPERVV